MANRKVPFEIGEHYHVYNRGIDKRNIFSTQKDVDRFIQSIIEFNTIEPIGSIYEKLFVPKKNFGGSTSKTTSKKVETELAQNKRDKNKLVDFIAYCVNPNHYHFIVRQVSEKGIQKFMHRLATGYTMYFNEKENRSGALFQGRFKSIHINSNEYLLHLSAYVNLNNHVHNFGGSTSKIIKTRSSWGEYINGESGKSSGGAGNICARDIVLGQFRNKREYKEFALESLETIRQRKEELKGIQEFLLE